MKLLLLTAATLLASGGAVAHPDYDGARAGCEISSDYSVGTHRRAFLFNRESGGRSEVGIGGGRLFIDGSEQRLSEADHQRLSQLEAEMRQLVPEVEKLTIEAVEIAFTALTEVARGLSSEPDKTVSTLAAAHRRIRSEMAARPLAIFNKDAMADVIKPIVAKYVPEIVGAAVRSALKAAFASGREAGELKARIERMERELDGRVDARARQLEPLAAAMCQRLRRMDGIDDSLEFRTPDGEPLQLLNVDPDHGN